MPVSPCALESRRRRPANGSGTAGARTNDDRLSDSDPALLGLPVLVVDDDQASAKLLSVILESEGCAVEIAYSDEDALRAIAEKIPRVVIIDLLVPHQGGLTLARRLRAEPTTCGAFIVAVTTANEMYGEPVMPPAECDGYFGKPIDPLSFAEHLRAILAAAT